MKVPYSLEMPSSSIDLPISEQQNANEPISQMSIFSPKQYVTITTHPKETYSYCDYVFS